MRSMMKGTLRGALPGAPTAALVCALTACAGGPPPPSWQLDAKAALDAGVSSYLEGDTRLAERDFARARAAIARTGRLDLLARAELMRCAAQVASLAFGPCAGFEALRADAAPAELAYAAHLAGQPLAREQVALLPLAQRPHALTSAAPTSPVAPDDRTDALRELDDPLARLIAIGVRFQGGRAGPAQIALAAETASAQGWRRPLLAWLGVQVRRAEAAGDADGAARLHRRIDRIEGGNGSAP